MKNLNRRITKLEEQRQPPGQLYPAEIIWPDGRRQETGDLKPERWIIRVVYDRGSDHPAAGQGYRFTVETG